MGLRVLVETCLESKRRVLMGVEGILEMGGEEKWKVKEGGNIIN